MKTLMNAFVLALSLAGSTAFATSLHCEYLANQNGTPAPGLGRAQVELGGNYATVDIVTEMGGGLSSGISLNLPRVSHSTYSDERNGARITVRSNRATLYYRGYSANCAAN